MKIFLKNNFPLDGKKNWLGSPKNDITDISAAHILKKDQVLTNEN